jgi:hypothetical protein
MYALKEEGAEKEGVSCELAEGLRKGVYRGMP